MSYKAFTRFKCLVRDQEVDGSNPFAPTTSFKANNLQRRKVPTTSWLCAKRSVVQVSSPNDLRFPLQIGVNWRGAATTFSSFVAHVAQTGRESTKYGSWCCLDSCSAPRFRRRRGLKNTSSCCARRANTPGWKQCRREKSRVSGAGRHQGFTASLLMKLFRYASHSE